MKIAIYNKTSKIVAHIIEDAKIYPDKIVGSDKTLIGFSNWTDFGYVTIPDTYKLEDHITGTETIQVPSPEDPEVMIDVEVPTYDSGAYLEGHVIPNADTVVDEYDASVIQDLELSELVEKKVRKKYSIDNENELNRKMNAIAQGLLDSASTEGVKAIDDFTNYHNYVEQCITEAKTELGIL